MERVGHSRGGGVAILNPWRIHVFVHDAMLHTPNSLTLLVKMGDNQTSSDDIFICPSAAFRFHDPTRVKEQHTFGEERITIPFLY